MKVTNNYYNQSTPSFGSRIVPSEVLEKTISHFIDKPKRGQDLLVGLKTLINDGRYDKVEIRGTNGLADGSCDDYFAWAETHLFVNNKLTSDKYSNRTIDLYDKIPEDKMEYVAEKWAENTQIFDVKKLLHDHIDNNSTLKNIKSTFDKVQLSSNEVKLGLKDIYNYIFRVQ